MNKLLIFLVILAVGAAVLVAMFKLSNNQKTNTNSTSQNQTSSDNSSGNPDAIVRNEISQSNQTDTIIKQSDQDTESTSSDTQTINGFSGAYNANAVQ